MTEYTVHARRWEHGWELDIEDVGVTQSRSLSDAERMVRTYLAMDLGETAGSAAKFTWRLELGDLEARIGKVRDEIVKAEKATARAAVHSRALARELRASGLSGRDVAAAMGVSPQRVSQLINSH